MANLETIVGTVVHVGQFTRDEHVHTYSLVEIETTAGRIDLKDAIASNELNRAIAPGKEVGMAVLRAAPGGKAKNIVLGVFDKSSQRLLVNEEMYRLRDQTINQAFLFTFLGIVAIPIGLAFFVVPGLLYIHVLWKAWTSIKWFPSADEIRATVESLPSAATRPQETAPKEPLHPA